MNAHRSTACERRTYEIISGIKLIQRMTSFMNNGIHAACDAVLIIMSGYADVVLVIICGEWMLDLSDNAVVGIDAHYLH